VPDIPFDDEQVAELRARFGVPAGEPDPTPDDLIVVFTAQRIVEDEWQWLKYLRLPEDDA
jgi:hypothetical protein